MNKNIYDMPKKPTYSESHFDETPQTNDTISSEQISASIDINEQAFRTLVETASIAIILIDYNGKIVMANQLACETFAYAKPTLLTMTLSQLLPEKFRERHQEHLARFFKNPKPRPMGSGMDLVGLKSDGTIFPIEVSLSAIYSEIGIRGVAFIADITDRKHVQEEHGRLVAERQRLKERQMEILQEFLSNAAHDLKTPLSVIMTKLYMLKRLSDKGARHIESIEENVKRLSQLIDNMLSMARLDATQQIEFNIIDINKLILRTIEAKQKNNSKNIVIQHFLDENIPEMVVNPDLFSVLLERLLDNAITYTSENGEVHISIHNFEHKIALVVADTGIGIPADEIPNIFERFYRVDNARQANESLNGLGLAIVKRIVELHQGTIEVKSKSGEGSSFHIFLPKSDVR